MVCYRQAQKLELMLKLCDMGSNCCSTTPIVARRLQLLLGGSNCSLTPSIVRQMDSIVSRHLPASCSVNNNNMESSCQFPRLSGSALKVELGGWGGWVVVPFNNLVYPNCSLVRLG